MGNSMTEPQPLKEPSKGQPKEQDRFKFEVVYLIPILASIIFGLACASLLKTQAPATIPVTPLPQNTASGSFGNAFYFVILVAVAATIFYLLLKRRSRRIIKGLIVVAMTTASLLLSLVYLAAVFSYLPSSYGILWIPLSIAITAAFDYAVFRLGSIARNVAVIGIGGALGMFFGFEIQLWTAVLILVFLAVYDIFAVYRGPVGKIAQSAGGLEDLQGLSYDFRDIQMGLGDLVFYSMLVGTMFFSFSSILPCLVSLVGIIAGSIVTFFILEHKGIFPGLPFPIMLGLAGGLIMGLVILPLL